MNYREDITYIVGLLYASTKDYTDGEKNKSKYILEKYNIRNVWLGLTPTELGLNEKEYIEYLIKSSDVIQREIKINDILG